MYEVANMTLICQHIDAVSSLAHLREYIHNVYELPSLEPTIASCVLPPVFPQNEHGSKPFDKATTALGPSST
jgi:hypothetical protein